jgi:formylglycine-generating enzyme required for sulfatase activity
MKAPLLLAVVAVASPVAATADGDRGMISIPAGCTIVGSPHTDEFTTALAAPARRVCLDAFYIDRSEVTIAEYRLCVSSGACAEVARRYPEADRPDDHPIDGVTWDQAAAYCRWAGKRLPTEAEWERAARGPIADGRRWPWGSVPPRCDQAVGPGREVWRDCPERPHNFPHTSPVCSHPNGNTAEGLCDVVGNVAEWVSDWFVSTRWKSGTSGRNPRGPCAGAPRCRGARGHVLKGAGWRDDDRFSQIFNRVTPWSWYIAEYGGIRCAQ